MLRKLAILILVTVGFTLPALAQPAGDVQFDGVTVASCNGTIMEGTLLLGATDTNGNPLIGETLELRAGGTTIPFIFNITPMPFAIDVPSLASGPITMSVRIAGAPATESVTRIVGCGGEILPQASDDRINAGYGDLLAVLYNAETSTGPGIVVYVVDGTVGRSIGAYAGVLFQIDTPRQNTIMAELGPTMLIALSSGEFQINIGPDAEGKVYEVILDELPGEASALRFYRAR
ncbi:MAG: hypothetical protein IPM16_20945 [Chloroflexi bacterium]|nr:hypothetical protein [Chloroflexota bacterium]